jgi:thiopurine S-methyltransferase
VIGAGADTGFWSELWRSGRTGFHRDEVSPELIAHHERVLAGARRVLVPLCGRTPDLMWLAQRHTEVVGIEFVEEAVTGYAMANGLTEIDAVQPFRVFQRNGLTILLGDFFDADPASIGRFDGLWDRAALVALPAEQRPGYARHCRELLGSTGVALVSTFDRDQPPMEGPPFSVTPDEVRGIYGGEVTVISEKVVGDRIIRTYAITGAVTGGHSRT